MRKTIIILNILLAVSAMAFAQSENDSDVSESKMCNYFIKLRQITKDKYTEWQIESEHLRNKPYKVVSDIAATQEILGERLQLFDRKVGGTDFNYFECEIMFNDGIKKRVDIEYGFVAYFPQLEILLFEGANSTSQVFDLNDSNTIPDFDFPHRIRIGNPYYHSVSPDKQLRVNGLFDGGNDCMIYFLEKWDAANEKYEYIGLLLRDENDSTKFCDANNWFWMSNNKALFKTGWEDDYSHYYEIEFTEYTHWQTSVDSIAVAEKSRTSLSLYDLALDRTRTRLK